TLAGFAQFVDGPAGHYLAAVTDEGVKQLLQIENARLPVEQAHHVDAEHVLHLGLGVQVVEDDLGHLATTQLDDHTHAVLVGLVAQLADALELLFLDQLGNTLDQLGLVNLVGQLVDDDLLAAPDLVDILDFAAGPDIDTTPAGLVGLDDSRTAIDDAGGGEVRARYVFHQLVDGDIRIGDDRQTAIDHLGQVVRRNIGRHAHGDTTGAVDQQVRHTGGQHFRDLQRAVVVVDPVDGFLVQVRQQFVGQPGHADFGIPHGRCTVAVHRAEVALTVDQQVAQGERLRHAHDGVVYGRVTVRVIFTDHVADHTGRLQIGFIPVVSQFAHGEQHTPVHWLETVTHIWKRPPADHAHRVIEVRLHHLSFDIDWQDFSGQLTHETAFLLLLATLRCQSAHNAERGPVGSGSKPQMIPQRTALREFHRNRADTVTLRQTAPRAPLSADVWGSAARQCGSHPGAPPRPFR